MITRRHIVALATVLVGCGDDDGSTAPTHCDAPSLQSALAVATSGEIVHIGACRIEGSFVVPAGVIVEGRSRDESALVLTEPGERVISLFPGQIAPTTLRALGIEGTADVVLEATGEGAVSLSDVSVVATRGTAIRIDGATLDARDVLVEGNDPGGIDDPMDATVVSVFGLRVSGSPNVDLTRVDVRSFARAAVGIAESVVRWSGGSIGPTRRTGMFVQGGVASLSDLTIAPVLASAEIAAAGALIVQDDADVEAIDLHVRDAAGAGVIASSATFRARGLTIEDTISAGVRAEPNAWIELTGESRVERAGGTGIQAFSASAVVLDSVYVSSTAMRTSVDPETLRAIPSSDGIAIVRPRGRVSLHDVDIDGSMRVDLVLAVSDEIAPADLAFDDVTVAPFGDAYGALRVGLDGIVRASDLWDADVARSADVAERDATLVGQPFEIPYLTPDS